MNLKTLFAIIFLLSLPHTILPMQYLMPETALGKGVQAAGEGVKLIADQGFLMKTDLPETANNIAKGMNTTAQILTNGLEKTTVTFAQSVNNSVREASDGLVVTAKTVCATLSTTAQQLPNQVAGAVKDVIDTSLNPSLDKLNTTTNKLVEQGVQAKVSIEASSIKTLGIMSVGVTLAVASIILIYKELTKVESNHITKPEESGWKHSFKQLFSNRYAIGVTGLVSGLLLIAKSNQVATLYAYKI